MEDYIINKIQDIFNTIQSMGSSSGKLVLSPQSFNAEIYSGIISIMNNAVMPVAYVILSLLFVLEMYNISVRTDAINSSMGMEVPFRALFKLAVCKLVIDSTKLIMEAIYAASSQLITNIGGTLSTSGQLSPADLETLKTAIGDMKFSTQLMTSVEVTIISLIVGFITILISVIVIFRIIEIYVYMAIAPIPLATFPNSEMSSIAKNFLKGFCAVCLQGVFIYIVLSIFPFLLKSAALGQISDTANLSASLRTAAGYSIVLLVAVFSCGKWSRSICNAM